MERNESRWSTRTRALATLTALAALGSGQLLAQAQTGNVYGDVHDDKGQPLPGVTLTLSSGSAPQIQQSDGQGQFRFVGVYPGRYRLEGTLDAFSPVVYESVVVNVNRNTTVELIMSSTTISETITITTESPILDRNKITTGTNVDYAELQRVPTARDPWVILQTTPGVLMDRVNVGGNESGQQSNYVGNGDDGTNSTWAVDGVEITDFCAIGSSSSYYDFDSFEEMQVTTGGSDAAERTGGVGLNLVTKRGTNEWRGSGRFIKSDESWQSDFNASSSDFGHDFDGAAGITEQQASFKQGNRIVSVEDWGAELGGPILKDKLWVWGSYGKNEIDLLTVSDFADDTQLETWNAKFNWQVAQSNTATVFFSSNDKTKQGRNAGPTRPQETTWNQSGLADDPNLFAFFSERPTVAKIEDTHIFGANFFLTGSYAESDGGFSLIPQGGTSPTQTNASQDEDFVFHNTFISFSSLRPQDQYKLDGSYFFVTGELNHELKFGANYRKAEVRSSSFWPGFGLDLNYYESYGYAHNVVQLTRPSVLNFEGEYKNGYVQDTLSAGNLTANVGLRYDVQSSTELAAEMAANPAFPDILPAVSYAGEDGGFEWKTLSPRLGLTYALGAEKKTLLRASYARFAEQIGGGPAAFVNPGYPGAYAYYYYRDLNGDGSAQANEVATDLGLLFNNVAYSPAFPGVAVRSNGVDPDLDAPVSDEITLGIEHALLPEFVVGLTATFRNETGILEGERLVFDCADGGSGCAFDAANVNSLGRNHQASDYVVATTLTGVLPGGAAYSVPVYGLRPGVSTRGGLMLTNSDRERNYRGVALTMNKRLSNDWMLRGNVSWNDWKWDVPDSELDGDRTPFDLAVGLGNDGERVLTCSGTGSGAKAGVCISSQWSYSFSGLYQVMPDKAWGFNVGASLNGREGYSNPYWVRTTSGSVNAARLVNVTSDPDDFKNDDIHLLDLRLEKELKFQQFGVTLGVDVFNVTNEGTVLQRNLRLRRSNSDHVQEVVSPRIFRLGARVSFN